MFYIYVLRSKYFRKSYVGSTDDLFRRLKENNAGKNIYTNRYKPWEIIYKEAYKTHKLALDREKYLKTRSGRRFLKKIFNNISGVV